jgi:hypothetical protein
MLVLLSEVYKPFVPHERSSILHRAYMLRIDRYVGV